MGRVPGVHARVSAHGESSHRAGSVPRGGREVLDAERRHRGFLGRGVFAPRARLGRGEGRRRRVNRRRGGEGRRRQRLSDESRRGAEGKRTKATRRRPSRRRRRRRLGSPSRSVRAYGTRGARRVARGCFRARRVQPRRRGRIREFRVFALQGARRSARFLATPNSSSRATSSPTALVTCSDARGTAETCRWWTCRC